MDITFLVRVERGDEVELWQRSVQRPYPGIPRSGDSIFLGDEAYDMPAVVADVTWENNGGITLSIDLPPSFAPALERVRFERL
jgi:hypothetical protein